MPSVIKIKRTNNNESTVVLQDGELSINTGTGGTYGGKLFIGDSGQSIAIGGRKYTQEIDNATETLTPSTLVKRDANNNIAGNSLTTDKLKNPVTITLSGDLDGTATFDGSSNIDISTTVVGGGGSGPTNLNQLGDVSTTGAIDGSILQYNASESKWKVKNRNTEPSFTYTDGLLSRIDYTDEYKLFNYVGGLLNNIQTYDINNTITKTKNFFYDVEDNLIRIEEV